MANFTQAFTLLESCASREAGPALQTDQPKPRTLALLLVGALGHGGPTHLAPVQSSNSLLRRLQDSVAHGNAVFVTGKLKCWCRVQTVLRVCQVAGDKD